MKKPLCLTALAGVVALGLAGPLQADDAEAARQKAAQVCTACHGPDGNSFNPVWPKLAGQHAEYTATQLKAYRCAANGAPKGCTPRASGEAALMIGQAGALTDAEIDALAAFYAGQAVKHGQADAALVESGERLYRGGRKTSTGSKTIAIPACIACHGPDGRGNGPAKFPAVGGQHATYVAAQLKAYRDESRTTDANRVMRDIALYLTDKEIEAVASYVQGLH
jgi:cytochrome c553